MVLNPKDGNHTYKSRKMYRN